MDSPDHVVFRAFTKKRIIFQALSPSLECFCIESILFFLRWLRGLFLSLAGSPGVQVLSSPNSETFKYLRLFTPSCLTRSPPSTTIQTPPPTTPNNVCDASTLPRRVSYPPFGISIPPLNTFSTSPAASFGLPPANTRSEQTDNRGRRKSPLYDI